MDKKEFQYKDHLRPLERGKGIPIAPIPATSTEEQSSASKFPTIEDLRENMEAPPALKFLKAKIDLSIVMPEPIPILKRGEHVVFSRENISTIGGKAKSRKTFLTVLFAAEFLRGSNDGKVLIVDTEMAKAHTYKTARRVHLSIGWAPSQSNDRLTVLSLREYSPDECIEIFREAIENLKPDLVFLDGIGDFVDDVNDQRESKEIVRMLMMLSAKYNCHICSVLHVNKVNEQLRGHLGTEIINKSETVLGVTTKDGVSIVKPSHTRNIPCEPFAFSVNDDGLPKYCEILAPNAKDDGLCELFESILPSGATLPYNALRSEVMKTANIAPSTAQNYIKKARGRGVVAKTEKGYYYCPSQEVNDDDVFS